MKQLQESDLKLGEIYWFVGSTIKFLNKISSINIDEYDCFLYNTTYSAEKGKNLKNPVNILESTPEEKHWLETCIKANKFVPYEEAMKTFIPEYVECIEEAPFNYYGKIGTVYKVSVWNFSTTDCILEGTTSGSTAKKRFKPSTKEAYEAQFVVKDEFVLPELWCIQITENNINVLKSYYIKQNYNYVSFRGWMLSDCGYDGTGVNWYHGDYHTGGNNNLLKYTEITFEQFKQNVLKESIEVLEEPKDKILAHFIQSDITLIHSVECSEGGVYRIGDKITVFDKYSPNKGKPFTIKSFRWSNDKSKICAVTELHTPNGIGLDKIELYVEPKVKVKDDFVLPEKWRLKVSEDYLDILFEWRRTLNLKYISNVSDIKSYYYIAEDGYGANFDDDCKIITFEQFKKYVLKDE